MPDTRRTLPWPAAERLARAVLAVMAACLAATLPARGQTLIQDAEIEALLSDYLRPIVRAARIPDGNIQIRIIQDPRFNAFVIDGKNVFMNTGTLMRSNTPNEVIGVIAHEIGHIDGKHIATMRELQRRRLPVAILFQVLGIGAAVAGGGAGAIAAVDQAIAATFLKDRREAESSADQAALTYLERTGQSGLGMITTFERLATENRTNSAVNPYLLSHPREITRIAQLRQRAEASPHFNKKDPAELQLRHDMMRAKLYGFLAPPIDVERIFPASNTTLPARYARAIARNCSGRCTRNIGEIDALLKEQPANPFFWELKGHLYSEEGRFAQAVPSYRKSLELLRGRSGSIKMQLGRALVEANDPRLLGEAVRLLESAATISTAAAEEDPHALKLLAQAYAGLQRIPEADLATARMHWATGNYEAASIFAQRALAGLPPEATTQRSIADDIVRINPRKSR